MDNIIVALLTIIALPFLCLVCLSLIAVWVIAAALWLIWDVITPKRKVPAIDD